MSPALPTDFWRTLSDSKDVFFWIRPVDERGVAVENAFAEAAYSKAQELRLYRWRELTDEAVRADLVERAVYTASRAQNGNTIQDPKGYLLTTFTRLVDHYISRESALWQTAGSENDEAPQEGAHAKSISTEHLDDVILRSQILNAMSPQDRSIWEHRLLGYEVQEIAAELGISPDCLSARISRCTKEVVRTLRRRRARQ